MKSLKLITLLTLLLSITCYGQLEKGTFLVGGTASISKASSKPDGEERLGNFGFTINPNIGYFIYPKLAVGTTATLGYSKPDEGVSNFGYFIGPFAKYYFLNEDKLINVFAKGSYGFSSNKAQGNDATSSYGYAFSAGPVLFFNRSVALELEVEYSYSNVRNANQTGINLGFQIHLDSK